MSSDKDTIAAIATPPGVGGIGVIRVSGQLAHEIAEKITQKSISPKTIQFSSFYDHQQEVIDHGIVLYFQAPHSFTGEDVVEFQGHGGPVIQDILLSEINRLNARHANPGEFSERAFLNNKIDLIQAEAIADLIESSTQASAKAAMKSLNGDFSKLVHENTNKIINLRSYIEAALDFSEEEIDFLSEGNIDQQLIDIEQNLQQIIKTAEQGLKFNEGLSLALVGLPNAGKSSLLNTLTGYESAIVTDIAGTTRDVISETISLNGIPVTILDTAGLRNTTDIVEQEGIKRTWQAIEKADKVLYLIDINQQKIAADLEILEKLDNKNTIIVYTKKDLLLDDLKKPLDGQVISTINNDGISELITTITGIHTDSENQTVSARRRHIDALVHTQNAILKAKTIFEETKAGELMAEDLRDAQKYLNEITGEFNTEDLLGKIFSSFCIGK